VGKITVVYVTFLCDVACQKLLNLANVSRSYSQNNTGTVFLRHGVVINLWLTNLYQVSGRWTEPAKII